MNRTFIGTITGGIATIELASVNLWTGILAAALTIICLIPTAIKNWHNLLYDYREFQNETGNRGFLSFLGYCVYVRRVQRAEKKSNVIPFADSPDKSGTD